MELLSEAQQVRYRHLVPRRSASFAEWPGWLPAAVRESVARGGGIDRLWRHQAGAADALFGGRHTALATGTASGKSLGYLLPVLSATYGGPEAAGGAAAPERDRLLRPRRPHTALYLAPTKALAHDQFRIAGEFGPAGWSIATIDGDSEPGQRDWARDFGAYVLTNPDLLHASMLPNHERWSSFLSSLRYVVIDEAHRYRGVFGSHVGGVLRRLRRIAERYGARPVFAFASATGSDIRRLAAELIGVEESEIAAITEDGSPHGEVRMQLWQPERTVESDAAALLAELAADGRQTIAFTPSRRMSELVALRARERLEDQEVAAVAGDGALPGNGALPAEAEVPRIESYRGGYLAADRRAVERALLDRTIMGVAATNALELGIDIAGMDAVIMAGFPGSRAAMWQQAGRAGRRGGDADVIIMMQPDPLDQYLADHPKELFEAPPEPVVLDAQNPYILAPQLTAAAQEYPLTARDTAYFGPTAPALINRLCDHGVLRRRPDGAYWTRAERAVDAIDLRSIGGRPVEIVDSSTGRVLGHADRASADAVVHPGAIYLHQGETYLCEELDLDAGEAMVHPERPGYFTQPQVSQQVQIVDDREATRSGTGRRHLGRVDVISQVIGYLRRDELTGTVWDSTPLDLPERRLRTAGAWWTVPLDDDDLDGAQAGAAIHAAEHALVGLLPLFARCDRGDVSGVSAVAHADTGKPTVFLHDTHAGGSGFARLAYLAGDELVRAAADRVDHCRCLGGCPACVVSAQCGRGNNPLDKAGAGLVLARLLDSTPDQPTGSG
ncbi:DEAD/DEAH box helicase [Microlunatus speluncae]|uniref:DEAD/DEAH box helicase n=1 Tax=Microlunatus speluncae TaxID=2594267 RepID=UPI001FE60DC5|nr:DEAD/DEAH box helicase [Microlunatus speluncae]